jgi:uncharacterized protein YdaT
VPWTPQEFKERHAKDLSPAQAKKASAMANAMLKSGTDEGVAIATAIKRAKRSPGEHLYGKKD